MGLSDRNFLEVKTIKVKSFHWALCKNFYIHRQINRLVGIIMLEELQGQINLFKKSSYNFLATLSCCIKITQVVVVVLGNAFSRQLFLFDVRVYSRKPITFSYPALRSFEPYKYQFVVFWATSGRTYICWLEIRWQLKRKSEWFLLSHRRNDTTTSTGLIKYRSSQLTLFARLSATLTCIITPSCYITFLNVFLTAYF